MANKTPEVYAWYFPNWHPDPRNDAWHGKNWTEWEVVKCARPRFEGHVQPKVPLWGYEDESDPKVMEKKIDAALEHGIDGFLWDMYWFEDGSYRLRALEEGFFGAANQEKFKIGIMWCNHDPIFAHPASLMHPNLPLMKGEVTVECFREMTDYFIKNYFWRPNYTRVDGKIFFGIWLLVKLADSFGGVKATRMILDEFRQRVRNAGLGELYIAAPHHNAMASYDDDAERVNQLFEDLGIDGGLRYSCMTREECFPSEPYSDYTDDAIANFAKDEAMFNFPLELGVCSGWDASPRTLQSDMYDNVGYPFTTVVTDNRPELFQKQLQAAKEFAERPEYNGHMVTISCWNEWTEGSYLEPDEQYGYGMLEAVRNVFGSKK